MKLEIVCGNNRREFTVPADARHLSVGRGPANDIALDEKGASRKHFTLEHTDEGWKIVDQLSANGTVLNGEKVNYAFLKDGDLIRVGQTQIRVGGLAPAKPVSSARRQITPPAASSGRRAAAAPAQSNSGVALLAASIAVLAIAGGGIWFIMSGRSGMPASPENSTASSKDDSRRQTQLSEEDQKLISDAAAIAASDAPTAEKLTDLDLLRLRLGNRGGLAATRIDEMRDRLHRQLVQELEGRTNKEVANARATAEMGDYRKAVSDLDRLAAFLGTEGPVGAVAQARGLAAKVETSRTEIMALSDEYVNNVWSEAERLSAANLHDDALRLVEELVARAWFKPGERALYESRLENLRDAGRKTAEPPVIPNIRPSVLDGIQGPKPVKLPGPNPLLPRGAESENELVASLHQALIEAVNKRKLTSDKLTYMGDVATARAADNEKITLNGARVSKGSDGKPEVLPYTKSVTWDKLPTLDLLALYDAVPKTDNLQHLAIVIFLFERGLTDEACKRAFQLYQRDNSLKAALDNLVATKRRIAIPEGGFVELDGRLVTPDEKENAVFNRRLREVLTSFERGLNHRDRKRREESDAAFKELLEMGNRAVAPGIAIMAEIRDRDLKRLEEASGMLAADDGKLRELKAELDRRRKHALELIMDTVKYPYPYLPEPDKSRVQADVEARVAAVREIWEDPLSFKGGPTADVEAIVERIQALVKRMGDLDTAQKYHTVTPEDDLVYLREIVGKRLSIKNFVPKGDAAAKELVAYNAEVMRYNEQFPTGAGHAEADCRAQVLITNEYRIMMGRRALKINDKLFWAARHHSRWQMTSNGGKLSHESPGAPRGTSFDQRMHTEGYMAGGSENLFGSGALRNSTAAMAHAGWLTSSGHHRNILSDWKVMAAAKFGGIWTQMFGAEDEGDGNTQSKKGV